jgi:light-regulated signal transduction histidine kinase (bacteriophytochrome)
MLQRRYAEKAGAEAGDMTALIVSAVNRMNRLIGDLLEYSRCTTQAAEARHKVDCNAAYHWARMNLDQAIKDAGATLTSDPLPAVFATEQIVRVMQNLIHNAVKYRDPNRPPAIHVSAQPRGDEWVISVADNGIGLDMRYAGRIFGVFQRLHGPDKYEGSGIGLAICQRIVERCGGRIWVESEPGKGSTFSFSLPAFDQEQSCAAGE